MIIALGLGNPGKKYIDNRHNVGFMTLDAFGREEGVHFSEKALFHAHVASFGELLLAKPDTYMNDSGLAAKKLWKHHQAPIAVIYDDIDIPLGTVKCSFGRGSGGHNGLQSVIDHLGHKDFFRIRIGVRPVHEELLPRIAPPDGFETFLLSDFAPFEKELLEQGIQKAVQILKALPHKNTEELMNEYN